MTHRNFADTSYWERYRAFNVYRKPVLLTIAISILPSIVLLVMSYFQSIAYAKANLEGIINTATAKTNQLLDDANAILYRSRTDLKDADPPTAVKILQRQIYNDFRFREEGIINSEGLLTISNLGIVNPPISVSATKAQFDPKNPNLQILGLGRTQIMQEQSIVLMLQAKGKISSVYLLVDPVVLTSFVAAIPDLDLGTNGSIVFMTDDGLVLNEIGASSSLRNTARELSNPSFDVLQVTKTTRSGGMRILGRLSRMWVLRYWLRELIVGAPLTLSISGILVYLFIRQMRQVNTLDYELKRGLAQNEFEVHYQPIVDLQTKQCVGAEALLRWRHPERGLIYPGLFIPIAEQTRLIIPMTEWLLEKIVQDRARLSRTFPNLYISMNISPTQLNAGDIEPLIQTLKQTNDSSEAKITFEITENKLLEEQVQVAQDAISRLKMCGTRFAIDDFGTGYSNIAYLQKLNVDQLKLDRLFVMGIENADNLIPIVDALIDLGNRMGLILVAEGIETQTQYQYLKERNVRYGQGWLFSRPLPYEDFEQFLQTQNA